MQSLCIMDMEPVVMNVYELMVQAGLTQQALAERVGCAQSEISRIERGERSVTVERLVQLAEALQVRAADLLEDKQAA